MAHIGSWAAFSMSGRSRSRWLFCVLLAAPAVLLVTLYLLSPALPSRTKGFIHGLIGSSKDAPDAEPLYNADKWYFQTDLEGFALPTFNVDKLRDLPPRNYRGPGREAYATFYATRNGTLQDPYFISAQQIVYRLLWDPKMKTEKHPVVVFVTPFISKEQREYFSSAGAIVRELDVRSFEPVDAGVPSRLQDLFTKLEVWRQTDFSRIAYLDSDAFPFTNLDAIFGLVPEQRCKSDMIPKQDDTLMPSVCRYVFGGWYEGGDTVNAGVMVLKPDRSMYLRLVRELDNKDGWNTGFMEQAFLSHAFSRHGAYPATPLEHEWNAGKDFREKGQEFHVLHHKMWADYFEPDSWVTADYNQTWADLLAFYSSPDFERMREEDLERTFNDLG